MELGNSTVKITEAETGDRVEPAKVSTFSNGVLKRHAPLHLHHHGHYPVVVTYKECLKNHAATLGGHALDGCGEFMPLPSTNPAEPTSLKCAACGCHRNFHRRDPEEQPPLLPTPAIAIPALEYKPHHRHHPLPPPPRDNSDSSPNTSPSPPPISSSYYPSAPHMLLALSHSLSGDNNTSVPAPINAASTPMLNAGSRKRYRTKFTQFQKEKMLEFAEKVGWKMQKRDEDAMNEFCGEIGVDRGVFKVWMHNNKNIFGKKEQPPPPPPPHLSNTVSEISTPAAPTTNGNGVSYSAAAAYDQHDDGSSDGKEDHDHALGTNGSS